MLSHVMHEVGALSLGPHCAKGPRSCLHCLGLRAVLIWLVQAG